MEFGPKTVVKIVGSRIPGIAETYIKRLALFTNVSFTERTFLVLTYRYLQYTIKNDSNMTEQIQVHQNTYF